jgi:hypothetical protein
MQSWRRFRSLSAADRVIVAEAAGLLAFIRVAVAIAPFGVVRRVLHVFPRSHNAARVAWAVAAAARHVPFRTTCLVESLAADAMLRRRGVASEIRFGVRPPDGGTLAAHAWVEHNGAVVFGARSDLSEYAVLLQENAR